MDRAGEVGCVLVDEAEQCRPAGVLPRQAEEVQPRDVGDAATVYDPTVTGHVRDVDPGVVGPVAGCPHHRPDLQRAAVGEVGETPGGADHAWPEPRAGP